ncbi:tripartite tricarboxylate transporter substrate binding protein [Rhodobium gokarnense]|uniref:Tripartite-type tricarboxylate transporter receptor subunit TctC n=1 Tax=Rhodobium gokarnense TaxID=364296 RepID=A0ABT3H8D3_9HYPH|nr:tripartite tricarboxylate transporter substrate binding protein [Rhodobium gokarnense]MCW2306641.1 tripartite-type tricarboxylate transporter receptor subunit TctC [Rhodobium gokarnense]
MTSFFRNTAAAAGFAAVVALAGTAGAAELEKPAGFGNRPLTMIVPFGAGGGSDQLARAMAKAMEEVAGITFQVVNKPGGGGTAAIPDFMLAPPDGYTVLEHIDNAISAYAAGDIRENPAEDWVPLCMTQITFSQIYIRSDEDRFTDWESFSEYAKAHPGDVTMANLGKVGSMELVVMEQLQEALGLKIKQIAFDKPAERYGALIGGHVDVLFEQPGDVRNFLDADQMKPILTFLSERPSAFADTPTHKEVGADFEALTRFRGFWVKAGVPKDRTDFLAAACKAGFETADYQAFNKKKYMHLIDSFRDTEGSIELINNAVASYREMYKKLGIGK